MHVIDVIRLVSALQAVNQISGAILQTIGNKPRDLTDEELAAMVRGMGDIEAALHGGGSALALAKLAPKLPDTLNTAAPHDPLAPAAQ